MPVGRAARLASRKGQAEAGHASAVVSAEHQTADEARDAEKARGHLVGFGKAPNFRLNPQRHFELGQILQDANLDGRRG
jgi:hypothetical protein